MGTSSVDIEKNNPSNTQQAVSAAQTNPLMASDVGSAVRTNSPASTDHQAITEWVDQIKTNYTVAALSPIARALCDFATKLTRTPWQMAESDISNLRTLGLSDRAIHDATQVIAYFNYINRIADGLHVDLEQGMGRPTS